MSGWRKAGIRMFRRDSDCFNAVIFGTPGPLSFWAWGVWAHKRSAEGIEFSLAQARKKANAKIEEAEFLRP
jgi:hypothetical protein